MIAVFYYTTFFTDWSNSEIAMKLHRSERTVNWLKNNMVRRCLWCENLILPTDDILKLLFLIAQGRSQNNTAIILSKIRGVKVSRSRVRSTIEKCKKDYGIDPYTVQNPQAICQKLIYDMELFIELLETESKIREIF